jgi:hypothetical protein
VATAVVGIVDVDHHALAPACPFHRLTGWWCPLCGSTRAVHHLLHGDVAGFVSRNALLVVLLPLAAVAWWNWLARTRGRTTAYRPGPATAVVTAVAALGFTVARNTNWGRALAP